MLASGLSWIEDVVFSLFLITLGHVWYNDGLDGVFRVLVQLIKAIPGIRWLLNKILSRQVKSFTQKIKEGQGQAGQVKVKLPEKGVPHDQLLSELKELKEAEAQPSKGKMFAYVYTDDSQHFELQKKVAGMFTEKTGISADHDDIVKVFLQSFLHENALNPVAFPSLRRFENEIISMTSHMLHGDDDVVGSVTSGGTESILMAMKTYRDRARHLCPWIKHPQMVAPVTIHPAHHKAASYFGFEIVLVPVGDDCLPDLEDYERAITPSTIALLVSAPQYCHGIVDPVHDISRLAIARQLPLHVDACFGGFMLPWVEKLGFSVPAFDFRLPGVTSISADLHKYGYATKGASVILYRNAEFRKYQIFACSKWPGGLFGSPSMAGTRPGGTIAASWVAMKSLGEEGYMKMAAKLMDTTNKLKEGIQKIQGLYILGKPHMTAFAVGSRDPDVNIMVLADVMESDGWKMERQQNPPCLHFTILPTHIDTADRLIEALRQAVGQIKANKGQSKPGSAAVYGMVAKIPDKSIIDHFIVEFFNELYKL